MDCSGGGVGVLLTARESNIAAESLCRIMTWEDEWALQSSAYFIGLINSERTVGLAETRVKGDPGCV